MVQQLAGSISTTSGAGTLLTGTRREPKTLDEHGFISFSQTRDLVGERPRYSAQSVTSSHVVDRRPAVGRIYMVSMSKLAIVWHTVHDNNRLHPLHSLHFPLDFALECTRKQGGNFSL